jgi:aerobic-type carbon monoxide dehydrogenase small subunit (CoxS/CutS family)
MSGRRTIQVLVNGSERRTCVEPRMLLSDALRDGLGLTGTHVGCEQGVCGACTVWLDDEPVRSCLMFAVQADAKRVTTVEGLSAPQALSVLEQEFSRAHALQCGFCTPGILMSVQALLRDNPQPDEQAVRELLSGHLCRCTGYTNIVQAVLAAARRLALPNGKQRDDSGA